MKYEGNFIILIFISSFSGILIALITNEINIKDIKEYENETNKINNLRKNKNHIINIALNIDNNYVYPCIVFLTSLLENIGFYTIYSIYILIPNNFNYNNKLKISNLINKYGKDKLNITFINMKDSYKGAVTNFYISTAAYYRLSLPSLLPYLDKILYIDSDVINFKDLSELYNLNLNDNIYFMGPLDNIQLIKELKVFGVHTKKYINSGVLLINLKSIRIYGIEQKLKNFVKKNHLDHHDQTSINAICYNNMDILSIKYSTFNFDKYENLVKFNNEQDKKYRYSEKELKKAFYNPVLLHYIGYAKPWNHGYSKSFSEYWWYYAKKSNYYEEILSYYEFPNNIIENLIKKIPYDGGLLKRNYYK